MLAESQIHTPSDERLCTPAIVLHNFVLHDFYCIILCFIKLYWVILYEVLYVQHDIVLTV